MCSTCSIAPITKSTSGSRARRSLPFRSRRKRAGGFSSPLRTGSEGVALSRGALEGRDMAQSGVDASRLGVPEANLVLVAFPNDRRMNLMTERDLRAWLAARANDLPIDGCPAQGRTLTEARIQILRYVPGQRLTLRARGFIEGEHEARYPF